MQPMAEQLRQDHIRLPQLAAAELPPLMTEHRARIVRFLALREGAGHAMPVPVNTCHHLGAIHVVAVDVAERHAHEAARGVVSTALLADAQARQLLEESQPREADFVVRPQATLRHFADFSDPRGLIAAGERAAEATLPEIAAVLERHRSLFVRAVVPTSLQQS